MTDVQSSLSDAYEARLSEFLCQAVQILDPFSLEEASGYGTSIEVQPAAGPRVRMSRFCWCDGDTCAQCSPHQEDLDHLDSDERAEVLDTWRRAGHVEGHGAPNFHFASREIEAKIWWYKYIGRGMETDLAEDRFEALVQRFNAWATLARLDIARASLERWCTPDLVGLDKAGCAALRESFIARLAAAQSLGKETESCVLTVTAEIRATLRGLERQAWEAGQCRKMAATLDAAGVPRCEEGLPEDLFGSYAPAYRLERVINHDGEFPSNDDPEAAVPAPLDEAEDVPF